MQKSYKILGVLVLAIAGVFLYFYENNSNSAPTDSVTDANNNNSAQDTNTATTTNSASTTNVSATPAKYKDGTYNLTENYFSPGGKQSIGVSITLSHDKITNATVTNGGTDGDSKSYQNFFISRFSGFVVGNSIDGLVLTTTSGASLTTGAFNKALNQIRKEAVL